MKYLFLYAEGGMKKVFFMMICSAVFFAAGCNSIGNGVAKNIKLTVDSPECIDIEGDWRIDIISDAKEESCEITIDENLNGRVSVSSGRKLSVSLADGISPMVAPVLRIRIAKPFKELVLEGNSICNIEGFKFVTPLETEISGRAVCIFNKCEADRLNAEVSDNAKLSFKGSVKEFFAEINERAVLEADSVDSFVLEGFDHSVCRIKSCTAAKIELEDRARAEFKHVKKIDYTLEDDADVKYPVVISDDLKK